MYVDSQTALLWRCGVGHEWHAMPSTIVNGNWCSICRRGPGRPYRRLSLEDLQETAARLGGQCLSPIFQRVDDVYRWRCANGHEFDKTGSQVRQRHWCKECSHAIGGTLDAMRAYAAERGGRYLSTEYVGQRSVLAFLCAEGHRFEAEGVAVKSGAWCPTCAQTED